MMEQIKLSSGLFGLLIIANLAIWAWAWAVFHTQPALLASALLAWAFGLRHAVDADHLAAIDNVVRKLMQDGQQPRTVGLWFALGHSTIVVVASLSVAATAAGVKGGLEAAHDISGVIGTLVSASFLLAIGAANLVIVRETWRSVRRVRRGGQLDDEVLDRLLAGRGLLSRLFHPLFQAITRTWHMYPLGFLFGLGFDTATEIGLLSIAATQASKGVSPWHCMVFPALFTAGMALVDTTDSVLMVGAYGWAFLNPLRKLWYNLTITVASAMIALLIAGIEVLGLLGNRLALTGPLWKTVGSLNSNFGYLGFAIIGILTACCIGSSIIYRWQDRGRSDLIKLGQ